MRYVNAIPLLGFVGILLAGTTAPSVAATRGLLNTQRCTISNATPLSFDAINTRNTSDGRASFVVTCPRTQATTISLIYSHHMKTGIPGAGLSYDLYATPNHAAIWGDGADGAPVSQTFSGGSPTILYIYARIPAHQQSDAGQFSDNIEIMTMP